MPRNLIKATKQPKDKHGKYKLNGNLIYMVYLHGKYKAQLTTAVVKSKHISNHKIVCGRANTRQQRILCETH